MKLPNGSNAFIGDKLEEYTLNPMHREGRHKARVFAAALGIGQANADVLERAVQVAAAESNTVQATGDIGFGGRFVLRFPLTTERGSAIVLTAWIIRSEEDFPRLTTCYIVK